MKYLYAIFLLLVTISYQKGFSQAKTDSSFDMLDVIIYDYDTCTNKSKLEMFTNIIDNNDSVKILLFNNSTDTIFLYATIFKDQYMSRMIKLQYDRKNKWYSLNLSLDNAQKLLYFSGLKLMQLQKICPKKSIEFQFAKQNLGMKRKKVYNIKLLMYYYSQTKFFDFNKISTESNRYLLKCRNCMYNSVTTFGEISW